MAMCEICGAQTTNPAATMCQACLLEAGRKAKLERRKSITELNDGEDNELKFRRLKARLCLDCGKPLIGLEKKSTRCPGCRARLANRLTGGETAAVVLTARDKLEKAVSDTAKERQAKENSEKAARAFAHDWANAPSRCRHCPWVTRIMPGVLYCPAAFGTCMRVPTEFYEKKVSSDG